MSSPRDFRAPRQPHPPAAPTYPGPGPRPTGLPGFTATNGVGAPNGAGAPSGLANHAPATQTPGPVYPPSPVWHGPAPSNTWSPPSRPRNSGSATGSPLREVIRTASTLGVLVVLWLGLRIATPLLVHAATHSDWNGRSDDAAPYVIAVDGLFLLTFLVVVLARGRSTGRKVGGFSWAALGIVVAGGNIAWIYWGTNADLFGERGSERLGGITWSLTWVTLVIIGTVVVGWTIARRRTGLAVLAMFAALATAVAVGVVGVAGAGQTSAAQLDTHTNRHVGVEQAGDPTASSDVNLVEANPLIFGWWVRGFASQAPSFATTYATYAAKTNGLLLGLILLGLWLPWAADVLPRRRSAGTHSPQPGARSVGSPGANAGH